VSFPTSGPAAAAPGVYKITVVDKASGAFAVAYWDFSQ
jgi:hypothetical protein